MEAPHVDVSDAGRPPAGRAESSSSEEADAAESVADSQAAADAAAEEIAALRARVAALEMQLTVASSSTLVPLPLRSHELPTTRQRLRPEVTPDIFEALSGSELLPRSVPLHILCVSSVPEERRHIAALAREANEIGNAITTIVVHEASDVDQAVSLIRAGALCDLVLLSADSGSGLVRLAVSAVRKVVHEEVPVVVALEGKGENEGGSGSAGAQVDLTLVHIAIRCGADGLLLRPIGREFLVNAWQHCLRRGPLFFERKLARTPPSAGRSPSSGSVSPSMNPVPGCFPGEARMSSLTGPVGMRPGEDLFRRELLRARGTAPGCGGGPSGPPHGARGGQDSSSTCGGVRRLSGEDGGVEEETLSAQQ